MHLVGRPRPIRRFRGIRGPARSVRRRRLQIDHGWIQPHHHVAGHRAGTESRCEDADGLSYYAVANSVVYGERDTRGRRVADPLDVKVKTVGAEPGLLRELQAAYADHGVNLVPVAGKWSFRTAADLAFLLSRNAVEQKKLSRAALETLAIIAYHQPVTRADIEAIRGVATSKGTLDLLLESEWVRIRGRRRAPGRPVTYGTSEAFLSHFGLDTAADLPGIDELKGAGLLDSRVPANFSVPEPHAGEELTADEEPLEPGDDGRG